MTLFTSLYIFKTTSAMKYSDLDQYGDLKIVHI